MMTHARVAVASAVALLMLPATMTRAAAPPQAAREPLADFQKRLDEYQTLRKKLQSGDTIDKRATAQQIELSRRHLAQAIGQARAGAQPGDIFQPPVQTHIRRSLASVFEGPDGRQLRSAVLDEDPTGVVLKINGPYPQGIPLSTMPVKVLDALPKLPKELEYRFVGSRLILYDAVSGIVVDYMTRALT